jgi:hypothetical protein
MLGDCSTLTHFSSFDQLHYFHYKFVMLGDCSTLAFFSSFDQLHYFHYEFVVLEDCSKCEHSWFAFAKNKGLVKKQKKNH